MSAAPDRCVGLVCHIGSVTGTGCSGNAPCPLEVLALLGRIRLGGGERRSINIPHGEWEAASGELAVDEQNFLWRILGFIDQPSVILERLDGSQRETIIMASEHAKRWSRSPLSGDCKRNEAND